LEKVELDWVELTSNVVPLLKDDDDDDDDDAE